MSTTPPRTTRPIGFRFKNIGPVKNAELELGNLTIIAGRNNTGKTYLVYTLYGFLKYFQGNPWRRVYKQSEHYSWIEDFTRSLRAQEQAHFPVDVQTISDHRRKVAFEYSKYFSQFLLPNVFSSRQEDFRKASVSIQLSELTPSLNTAVDARNPIQYDGTNLIIDPDLSASRHFYRYRGYLSDQYTRFLVPELLADISIISAERFGISLFYKELDFTKNQLVEMLQELRDKEFSSDDIMHLVSDRVSSRYALPVKDNIHFTRSIAQFKEDKGKLFEENLFGQIEQLMDGSYTASDSEIRFHSRQPRRPRSRDRAFDIPLHRASSSARGLSDLYFFLKHQARPHHLLLIDEPESHLDTKNQVLLARVLARFVRAGVRVLITTHSDYLLKEINNLIMLCSDFEDKEAVKKTLGYSEHDGLSPELVRAYIAEDGGLSRCTIDSMGIDVPPFDEVIREINHASHELSARAGGRSELQDDA